jgi:hypothetical protein
MFALTVAVITLNHGVEGPAHILDRSVKAF